MHHPQVVQSPILMIVWKWKLMVTPDQKFPKLLQQVSVRELHNSLVSDPENVWIEEARDAENNIIISDSTLRELFPPQLKQMSSHYKVICGCECCISSKTIHSPLLSWHDWYYIYIYIYISKTIKKGLVKNQIAYMKYI